MKAVVLTKLGDASGLEFRDVPLPPEPKNNEIRVKIKVASFNPVDYKIRKGLFGVRTPTILGGDFSGVVDSVGPGVKNFTKGDEVFGLSMGPGSSNGSYAQYVTLSEYFVEKKPANISHADAAGLVIAGGTAIEAIRKSPLQEGCSVLVIGASGGVGSAVIQLLNKRNVKIFATAGSTESAEYLNTSFGIPKDRIVNYSGIPQDTLRKKLIETNNGQEFNVVLDLVGGDSKKLAISVLSYDGTVVSIVAEGENFSMPLYQGPQNLFALNGTLAIVFLAAPVFSPPEQFPFLAKILKNLAEEISKGVLKPLKTEVVGPLSVETVREAHARLEALHTKGKMVMEIEK